MGARLGTGALVSALAVACGFGVDKDVPQVLRSPVRNQRQVEDARQAFVPLQDRKSLLQNGL